MPRSSRSSTDFGSDHNSVAFLSMSMIYPVGGTLFYHPDSLQYPAHFTSRMT